MKLQLFFILLILVVMVVLVFRSTTRENYSGVLPRILHLVLYSPGTGYDQMYEATRGYYKSVYYYSYDDSITEDHKLVGDRLLIKGKESYLPGILEKTLKAFRVFPLSEYDYVLRSNVSTVVDVESVRRHLAEHPLDYAGGYVHQLQWLDKSNGIVDRRHWGTKYASGTAILLSTKAVNELLEKPEVVDKSVIDDVAIGVAMKRLGYSPVCFLSRFIAVEKTPMNTGGKWFFRHRTADRVKDSENMKWLLKTLTPSSS
jgi:hypothetical protein